MIDKNLTVQPTPSVLAKFVAGQMLRVAELPKHGKIRVLDPAVGDGVLLDELIKQIPLAKRKRLDVVGYDTNPDAIKLATQRLQLDFPSLSVCLISLNTY